MADTVFSAAIRTAIASLNNEGLTHDQWADAATSCARAFSSLGIDDPTVRSTAALGALVRSGSTPPPHRSSVAQAFTQAANTHKAHRPQGAAREEGRTALRIATHAATLNSRGLPLLLLAAVERDLASTPSNQAATSLDTALRQWSAATAMIGRGKPNLSPHVAVAIAVSQRAMLRRGRELLTHVEVNPDISGIPDRLRKSIDANIDAWSRAAEHWYDASLDTIPREATHSGIRLLSLAATDLARTLKQDHSPGLVLDTLIRSGFGGNLIAGIVATSHTQIGRSLVTSAASRLEMVADHFTDQRSGPPFRDRTSPAKRTAPTPAGAPSPAIDTPVASTTEPQESGLGPRAREGLDAPVLRLSREEENSLAQRRDVGVLAQAALDKVPAACRLTAAVADQELQSLAVDGRAAVAQLVASMIPTMVATNRWLSAPERADAVQNAAVDVAKAAARWDPNKGARWLTFAWNASWWASTDSRKELDVRPVPYEFDLDEVGTPLQHDTPDPQQALLGKLERNEQRHLLHQIRTLNGDQIRPDLLAVVLEYHGLDGKAPKTFTEIAMEHDSSPTTVTRHYREAFESLRVLFPSTPAAEGRKPWRRPEHRQQRPATQLRR